MGLSTTDRDIMVAAFEADEKRYVMKEEFDRDTLEEFVEVYIYIYI